MHGRIVELGSWVAVAGVPGRDCCGISIDARLGLHFRLGIRSRNGLSRRVSRERAGRLYAPGPVRRVSALLVVPCQGGAAMFHVERWVLVAATGLEPAHARRVLTRALAD